MDKAQDYARGHWPQILTQAGIDATLLNNKHRPCPVCGGKDRFRFDDKEGRGTWICNQCGAGDGFKLLQNYLGTDFKGAVSYVESVLGIAKPILRRTPPTGPSQAAPPPTKDRRELIASIWRAASPHNDGLKTYFSKRGCLPRDMPADIRIHPELEYWHDGELVGRMPAIVALVKAQQGRVVGLHRIYLSRDCTAKAETPGAAKKLLSRFERSTSGCAIQMYPQHGELAIAEGIETALAVRCGLPNMPVWATVIAGNMKLFNIPGGLKKLLIFGDLDRSNTGANVAYHLADRALEAGVHQCKVLCPGEEHARAVYEAHGKLGKSVDWLDVWNVAGGDAK